MEHQRSYALKYYDFEADFDYRLQLYESIRSRTAIECNRAATEEFFKKKLSTSEVLVDMSLVRGDLYEDLNDSVKEFMNLFKRHPSMEATPAPINIQNIHGPQLHQALQVMPIFQYAPISPAPATQPVPQAYPQKTLPIYQAYSAYNFPTYQTSEIYPNARNFQAPLGFLPPGSQGFPVYHQLQGIQVFQVYQPPQETQQCQLWEIPPEIPDEEGLAIAPDFQKSLLSRNKDESDRHLTFARNLKHRVLNVIKGRIGHLSLKKQMEILDSVSGGLDRDPLKVLEHVDYQTILSHDDFDVLINAKQLDEETRNRIQRRLNEMAMGFCLSSFSGDVAKACDENTKVRKRLYEL